MIRSLAISIALAALACAHGDGAAKPPTISNVTEADAALGRVVQVTGTAQREKLGDAIAAPGIAVVCLDTRFPDPVLGATVTVEGALDRTDAFQAVTSPSGEISQGTEPGTSIYVMRRCILR